MRITMAMADVKAIQNGMRKYNCDSKQFLEIVNGWVEDNKNDVGTVQYEKLLHLQKCAKTYYDWGF